MQFISRFALASVAALFAAPVLAEESGFLSPAPMAGSAQRLQAPAAAPVPRAGAPTRPASSRQAQTPATAQTPGPQTQGQPNVQTKPKPARKKAAAPAREFVLLSDPTPTLQPQTFFATAKASERYAAIADAGGWPKVPANLKPGSKGPAVALLRQRLAIEGDLSAASSIGEGWDEQLTQAVKRFQSRMGIRQNGVVSGKTLTAMNIPAAVRFRQLASSAQRIAGSEFAFGPRYVVVNIPSASVEAVENGRVVRRYVAVVGDVKHQSPTVTTRVTTVNLNPTWTVPTSIIKNEIIPKMRRDPGYLARSRIRILDGGGNEISPSSINWSSTQAANYTLRQDHGNSNALGNIRINMPNKDAVYMHDTPSKKYFGNDYRFLSHGCVRVQGVFDLAEWLLQGTQGSWTKSSMQKIVATQRRQDIRLAQPVPVTWIYMTGWADNEGVVHFRDDVYKIDRVGSARTAGAR